MKEYIKPSVAVIEMDVEQSVLTASTTPGSINAYDHEDEAEQL